MNIKDLLNQKKSGFEGVLDFYKNDIASISTGRATPALVEDIIVDAYGQRMHVKELATITTPEPRSLVIQPWDKGVVEAISGAIRKSEIGLNPVVDGQIIRLNIPSLTEERRKEFIKSLKHKTEEARVKIRRIREEIWNKVQAMERGHEIGEDDKFKAKDDLQKIIDDYNKKIEELENKKEQELLN
ncbi:MAG: ribosome recycling factor [Candidatus Yanofskybacteria bacterium]|nr:ribosome recycling factor [Candidatus Yanofskybacteria bacterium]